MHEHLGADEGVQAEIALLAQRAGVAFSDDELADLVPKVAEIRADLEQLRTTIRLEEEPAHTFAKQVRGSRR